MKSTFTRGLRASIALGAAALVAVSATACGSSGADEAGGLTTIKSATFPGEYYFTDVVAQKKGFFAEHGLKVDFVTPQSGTTSTQLMESGQVQLMISDGVLTIKAQDQGLGVSLIGSVYNRSAWSIYVADDDKDLAGQGDISALAGKKIGVTGINAGTDLALQTVLKDNGLDPDKDVKRVGVGLLTAAVGQFSNGGLDAYVFGAPADQVLGAEGLAHEYYRVRDGGTSAADVVQGGMLASTKWLASGDNRETAKRWLSAQEEAMDWIRDPANLTEAGTLFADAFGGTPEGAEQTIKSLDDTVYPHTLEGLKVPRAEYDNSVAALAGLGLLDGPGPTYEEAVDEIGQE